MAYDQTMYLSYLAISHVLRGRQWTKELRNHLLKYSEEALCKYRKGCRREIVQTIDQSMMKEFADIQW